MTTHAPEPTINDLNPVIPAGVPREPIALIDTSGSMTWSATGPGTSDFPLRRDVVGEAMGMLIRALEGQDSQAAAEQAAGDEDRGGLLVHLFADQDTELGDLNSANWRDKWGGIRWGGGTRIMSAWQAAQDAYLEEFGQTPVTSRPALLTLVITDGEAVDGDQFAKVMQAADAKSDIYFRVAIVGFGEEHDTTLHSYKAVESANADHVRVVTFGGETDPQTVANGLISLVGRRVAQTARWGTGSGSLRAGHSRRNVLDPPAIRRVALHPRHDRRHCQRQHRRERMIRALIRLAIRHRPEQCQHVIANLGDFGRHGRRNRHAISNSNGTRNHGEAPGMTRIRRKTHVTPELRPISTPTRHTRSRRDIPSRNAARTHLNDLETAVAGCSPSPADPLPARRWPRLPTQSSDHTLASSR